MLLAKVFCGVFMTVILLFLFVTGVEFVHSHLVLAVGILLFESDIFRSKFLSLLNNLRLIYCSSMHDAFISVTKVIIFYRVTFIITIRFLLKLWLLRPKRWRLIRAKTLETLRHLPIDAHILVLSFLGLSKCSLKTSLNTLHLNLNNNF